MFTLQAHDRLTLLAITIFIRRIPYTLSIKKEFYICTSMMSLKAKVSHQRFIRLLHRNTRRTSPLQF